jgi:hypothetical protein
VTAASVTIDVDSLACYAAIHDLPFDTSGDDPCYAHALPRFLGVCEKYRVRATLFVIGRDLERPGHRALLARAVAAGHEIASHSFAHDYRLSRLPPHEIDDDLARADEAIAEVTGAPPVGFRAPGYNQSEALFDALERRGYRYDSSFFPAPAYFAARATAIGLYGLRGRSSSSLVGDPREFLCPRAPFRPAQGARYRRARAGEAERSFLEIPIGVASPLRLPWIGTSLALAPDVVGRAMTKVARRQKGPAVLELHAIDFLAGDEASPELRGAQPDLQVDLDAKLRRLDRAISALARHRDCRPLMELAQ